MLPNSISSQARMTSTCICGEFPRIPKQVRVPAGTHVVPLLTFGVLGPEVTSVERRNFSFNVSQLSEKEALKSKLGAGVWGRPCRRCAQPVSDWLGSSPGLCSHLQLPANMSPGTQWVMAEFIVFLPLNLRPMLNPQLLNWASPHA